MGSLIAMMQMVVFLTAAADVLWQSILVAV
jgi:hypothetical protein